MTEKHDRSREQEARIARDIGGKVQPRSGAGWMKKNDVRHGRFHIEAKRTQNRAGITIKSDDLADVRRNAIQASKMPVLTFELAGRDYVILTQSDFKELAGE